MWALRRLTWMTSRSTRRCAGLRQLCANKRHRPLGWMTRSLPIFGDSGMSSDWRRVTVADLASPQRNSLVGGPFGSNLVGSDYVDDGVPVIRGQNMGKRWVGGDYAFVTPAKAASLEANIARPGDIVFTQRGTLGQVSLVPDGPYEQYVVSQSQMKLTTDRTVADPMFLYYVFSCAEYQDLPSATWCSWIPDRRSRYPRSCRCEPR